MIVRDDQRSGSCSHDREAPVKLQSIRQARSVIVDLGSVRHFALRNADELWRRHYSTSVERTSFDFGRIYLRGRGRKFDRSKTGLSGHDTDFFAIVLKLAHLLA